ncbi:ATP-grasp domain-containing protein, partial [Sandarakinorhabdus sp.]|uniref:ATP-grasp domain-containing protein n=1 Tax=Sandarakinorhabdus sp. TaxID=1916663 RepID=UPI0033400586
MPDAQPQSDPASGRLRVWYNAGYSETGNAIALVNQSGRFTTIASHSRGSSPMLVAADHAQLEPSFDRSTPAGAAAYTDWCLDFAAANRIDLFVVQRGRSAIARRLDEFAAIGTKALVTADADTLEKIENKAQFYTICAAAGLPTPLAISVHDAASFDAALDVVTGAGHAACIKPPRGVFGSGYFKLDDERPAFDRLMSIDDRVLPAWMVRAAIADSGSIPDLLVMQYLPGTEWSVDCLCDHGRI